MENAKTFNDLPTAETASLARESASALSRLLRDHPEIDRAQIRLDGEDLILPRAALDLLRKLLAEMAQGNAVTIVPVHAELTTQEAADLLNVSRPYLIKLLTNEQIPFTMIGSHRRIRLQDLLSYKHRQDERSRDALTKLAEQAQDLNMGY
ncbi:MAG: helix-turn-helix domain-containing protein [Wenzhouxiangella sp.]